MKIIPHEQGSISWLEYRKTKIMASDAPCICGVSPYKSSYQTWLEKLGLYNQEVTESMTRGTELEPGARQRFNEQYGKFTPCVVEHDTIPWMAASLDGLDMHGKCLLEIKCSTRNNHLMVKGGEVPDHWMYQVQHQLMVTGCQWGYVASFCDDALAVRRVLPDPDLQSKILAKEMEFWELLCDFTPPPLTDKDFVNRDDLEWIRLATEYREKEELIKALENENILIKQKLIELSEGKNSVGGGIKLMKIARKGNIDYNSIPVLQDMDLNKYRKPTSEYIKISKV